ncbi:unnamed protein product [Prorocentrum cordatum]|uniref:HEPN domain-containing protein n=1 Tax=Prorocentrum cordatum TaxID=2364126 RepID=A0ABN9VF86_9DINO|nr:unnamed protein product [Polarella glacialis]
MQESSLHMELLHVLGMQPGLSPSLVLLCAKDMHGMADHCQGPEGVEELRPRSFELVEEWARSCEEVWPPPRPEGSTMISEQTKAREEDMRNLLRASYYRILMARRHVSDTTIQKEVVERNSKRQKTSAVFADAELVAFQGCAFKTATQVTWSVAAMEDHRSAVGEKDSFHLQVLLERHPKGIQAVFGGLTALEQATAGVVIDHLGTIVRLLRPEEGAVEAFVKSESALHEDLRGCWSYVADCLNQEDAVNSPEVAAALDRLRALPCCAVTLEDVADRPADVTTLTLPGHAFFHLPMLKGKEANLRLYLRQVHAETSKEAAVFRALGASDRPRAADYAAASERVAKKAAELGRANWEWVVACLEACVRGIHEDLTEGSGRAGDGEQLQLGSLHLFTNTGDIRKASELVWADEPRWLKRCEGSGSLSFCALLGQDQRELAASLVKHAGLRQLTVLVEERRVDDDLKVGSVGLTFKDSVEQLVQSSEFAVGVHAVILHNCEASGKPMTRSLADVSRDLRSIRLRATGQLRSALFYKDDGKVRSGGSMIAGSEQDQQCYYDEREGAVHIGDVSLDLNEDTVIAELVSSLRRAVELFYQIDAFLLEAMVRCGVRHGPAGINPFLEKREIKTALLGPRHLGPGDPLPEDLQDHVVWSMDATFGEGEVVTVMLGSTFIIAEVAKWPDERQEPQEDGLNKSYNLRVSADTFEVRKQFQIYKIAAKKQEKAAASTELVHVPKSESSEKEPGLEPGGEDGNVDQADKDARQLADVKQYLHEMGKMEADDYKAVMRRLFKTWHPDKVGDTPIANKIFHLLRAHEQWYKRRLAGENVGDDSWLDGDDGNFGEKDKEVLAIASGDQPEEDQKDGQNEGSWFFEFEREMMQTKADIDEMKVNKDKGHELLGERVERPSDDAAQAQTAQDPQLSAMIDVEPAGSGAPRIVDKQLSPRFAQEAQVELVVAKRCLKEMEGLPITPARSVWHCQQTVEMALRATMLRTCGLAEDECAGGAAHDLIDFVKRIKTADTNTEEQKRAVSTIPLTDEDVEWLKHAYLAARYPKPGRYGVPAMLYSESDAQRGLKIAEEFLAWAANVEDLPDPSKFRRKRWLKDEAAEAGKGIFVTLPSQVAAQTPALGVVVAPPGRPDPAAQLKETARKFGWGVSPSGAPSALAPDSGSAAPPEANEAKRPAESADMNAMPKRTKRWARPG